MQERVVRCVVRFLGRYLGDIWEIFLAKTSVFEKISWGGI